MKKIITVLLLITMVACNNKKNDTADDGFTTDPNAGKEDYTIKPDAGTTTFNGRDSSSFTSGNDEKIKRRALIFMGIDSTYYAINQIEDIKNELSGESAVSYSVAERNIRSKALYKLNMIENILTRRVDSALLVNLKSHTAQLDVINEKMITNTEHLQDLSEKLARATRIVDRLTTILGACISSGFIKPPTPVTSTSTDVKATVN